MWQISGVWGDDANHTWLVVASSPIFRTDERNEVFLPAAIMKRGFA